jgi:pyruvoyl-dependent arginine decarboxylase (PvlArgDC)
LEELETGLDCWLFLFKNINKLKSVPEVFRGTILEKIMEMSRIKSLPKEQKEDWKIELDNNKYVQEGIQILAEQAAVEMAEKMAEKMAGEMAERMAEEMAKKAIAEAKADKAEATINAYKKGEEDGVQKGELKQLKLNIAKMRSKGMSDEKIKAILDLEDLPELE